MTFKTILKIAVVALIVSSCKNDQKDLSKLPTLSKDGALQAVIEIPAGTNKKIEYNKSSLQFKVDTLNGEERIIKFLPYLGNYGFIPSTLSDKTKGGDGDPLDVIVLSEAVPTGTVMQVIPIGVMNNSDEGEEDDKIIAVPKDKSLRTIDVENYNDWSRKFGATKTMLIQWYRNYDNSNQNQIKGFRDEKSAKALIEKWQLKPSAGEEKSK